MTRLERINSNEHSVTSYFSGTHYEILRVYSGHYDDTLLATVTRHHSNPSLWEFRDSYDGVIGTIVVEENGNFSSGECLNFEMGFVRLFVPNTFDDFVRLLDLVLEFERSTK